MFTFLTVRLAVVLENPCFRRTSCRPLQQVYKVEVREPRAHLVCKGNERRGEEGRGEEGRVEERKGEEKRGKERRGVERRGDEYNTSETED